VLRRLHGRANRCASACFPTLACPRAAVGEVPAVLMAMSVRVCLPGALARVRSGRRCAHGRCVVLLRGALGEGRLQRLNSVSGTLAALQYVLRGYSTVALKYSRVLGHLYGYLRLHGLCARPVGC
jgi:hypothetical protein